MKQLFTVALLSAAFGSGTALAVSEGWTADYEAAKKQAAEENKDLLLDFTGSDWCGWCIKLKDEVFKHDEFKEGVKDDFVLVELDFPQDDTILDEETKEQNQKLMEKYGPKGFPTILLTDAEGRPYAATGYREGGPESYVSHLDALQEKKKARNEAFAKAEDAEGAEKAKILASAIQSLELENSAVATFYGDEVEQIKTADPADESGYVKNLEQAAKHDQVMQQVNTLMQNQDAAGAIKLIEETAESGDFEGEILQQIVGIKGMILAQTNELDEALKALEEAKAIAPQGEVVPQIDQMIQNVKQMQAETGGAPTTEAEAE